MTMTMFVIAIDVLAWLIIVFFFFIFVALESCLSPSVSLASVTRRSRSVALVSHRCAYVGAIPGSFG
jgi:hypothetical protein